MKWIPFFKTGAQTDSLGREKIWTSEEVDNAVNNYNKLTKEEKRPIVIGHPGDNLPILGFVEKVKRVGDTLYALPGNVSQSFKNMVKNGAFPNRSISFNNDGSINHFGFLPVGIEPAVKGLGEFEFSEENNKVTNYSFSEPLYESDTFETDGDLFRIEAELEIINKQIDEMLKNNKHTYDLENELKRKIEQQNIEAEKSAFMFKLERLTETGKITPAVKSKFTELSNLLTKPTNDYSAYNKNMFNLLGEIIDLSGIVINYNETVTKPIEDSLTDELTLIANTYKI